MTKRKPIVFLSYASADVDLADYLVRDLHAQGVDVWSDRSIQPGEKWHEAIVKALEDATIFVLLISPDALKSEWMNFELGVALSRDPRSSRRRILPVLTRGVDRKSLPAALRNLQAVEMEGVGIAEASHRVAKMTANAVRAEEDTEDA